MIVSTDYNLVWFRQDLRIADNKALYEASLKQKPMICLYIHDLDSYGNWPIGGASKWWLHQALVDLDQSLSQFGNKLIIRNGNSLNIIEEICANYKVENIFYNKRFEPHLLQIDNLITSKLKAKGHKVHIYNSLLLYPLESIFNKENSPYKTFTSFWKFVNTNFTVSKCLPKPKSIPLGFDQIPSCRLESLLLESRINSALGIQNTFKVSEQSSVEQLYEFSQNKLVNYQSARDIPGLDGGSKLSPYLHFGQISPNLIFLHIQEIIEKYSDQKKIAQNAEPFIRELGWREFAYYTMLNFPHTINSPLRSEFDNFPWQDNHNFLLAWQKGLTGYPIVDAGMRQLWHTGLMHNRVRMIVASFLCKDLFINWLTGAKWFFDTLVDADLASNTLGWQWSAGCGVDAQPYFRIFNPVLQSKKFDGHGLYIKKWVPELAKLPVNLIHEPWLNASKLNYPKPIVNHELMRVKALSYWQDLRK